MASYTTALDPRLELIGGATLIVSGKRERLERKTAGCLAYLALEGEQSRSILAGLLWSDVVESRAKGNLRQCLYKLKQTVDVIQGDEVLSLVGLEVDAVNLENGALLGDYIPLTLLRGELLAGYTFDDCPDFEDWLYQTRRRWIVLRHSAFQEQIKVTESSEQKLALSRAWLKLEPLSEQALRTLVTLLLEEGQPTEARMAVETFQARHLREYNEPATHVLAWLEQRSQPQETPQNLLKNALAAKDDLRHVEAASFFLQAADVFTAQGELSAECDALLDASELMNKFDRTERFDALLERIAGLARTPQQVLRWRMELMNRSYVRADWQNCLREAERVIRLANRLEDQDTALDAQGFVAATYVELGDIDRAAQVFEEILSITRQTGDNNLIHAALNNLAYARDAQRRLGECLLLIAEAIGDVPQQLSYLNQLTFYAKTALGRNDALQFAKRGLALHQHITGQEEQRIKNLGFLGELQRDAGMYRGALESVGQALEIGIEKNISCSFLHRMKASILLQLGAFSQVTSELESGFARTDANNTDLMSLTAVQLRLKRWQGMGTLEELEDTIAAWQDTTDHGFMKRFQFERIYYLHGQERVQFVQETLGSIQGFAEFFLALALLEAGEPYQAFIITSSLVQRLEHFDPNDLYTPEILLTHARVLTALEYPEANAAWQNARDWVLDKAKNHVSDEFKKVFLGQNPINRSILVVMPKDIKASVRRG
jgi:DNA-binding SARP family transcriptional activator